MKVVKTQEYQKYTENVCRISKKTFKSDTQKKKVNLTAQIIVRYIIDYINTNLDDRRIHEKKQKREERVKRKEKFEKKPN